MSVFFTYFVTASLKLQRWSYSTLSTRRMVHGSLKWL